MDFEAASTLQIQKEYKIPTISQRLYHHGREVHNPQTIEDLEILDQDDLYVKEVDEDVDALNSGAEDKASKRRKEGKAFGGTLLGRHSPSPASGSREASMAMDVDEDSSGSTSRPEEAMVNCPTCTLRNFITDVRCTVCNQALCGGGTGMEE